MMKWQNMTFLVMLIAIVSCNPMIEDPTVSGTVLPTFTGTVKATPIPTRTNVPTEEPTKTATVTPTKTQTSSKTPLATPTIPRETLSAFATLGALVTQNPELGAYYSWESILYSRYAPGLGLSPNGLWATFFSVKESAGLNIVRIDGTKQWEVYYAELAGMDCPCGEAVVAIDHWSADGKYLYLWPDMRGDGGYGWFWRNYVKLICFDLEKGEWVDTQMGAAASFSPDDKYIAYRSGQAVVIHELETGIERQISISSEYDSFGRILWAHDDRKIMFVSSINDLDQAERPDGFTLYLVDFEQMLVEPILEKDQRYLYPVEWLSPNTVLLQSLFKVTEDNLLESNHEQYVLDLETFEITEYQE